MPKKFLIIDADPDDRFILGRAVHRRFPRALVEECGYGGTALFAANSESHDAIIVHGAREVDGIALIRALRRIHTHAPIILVSKLDRARAALEAGATRFLRFNEWFKIGEQLEEIVGRPGRALPDEGVSA